MEEALVAENKRAFKGVWIPADVWLNKELNLTEKMLYAEIDSLDGEDGCFASNEYLSSFFGLTVRAIQLGLSRLKKFGLIEQKSFDGRMRCLRTTRRKLHTSGEENFTPQAKKTSPIYNNIEKRIEKSPHTPQGAVADADVLALKSEEQILSKSTDKTDGFEEFWKAYPKCQRKVGKAKCLEYWKRHNLSAVKSKVLTALVLDSKSDDWTKYDGKYVPMPATWLNRKRYEDIEESPKATTTSTAKWSVLTYDDINNGRSAEWDSWDRIGVGAPPSWSVKDLEWIKQNREIIASAKKL